MKLFEWHDLPADKQEALKQLRDMEQQLMDIFKDDIVKQNNASGRNKKRRREYTRKLQRRPDQYQKHKDRQKQEKYRIKKRERDRRYYQKKKKKLEHTECPAAEESGQSVVLKVQASL